VGHDVSVDRPHLVLGAEQVDREVPGRVTSVYENLWNRSGMTTNTYVQAFAVALGIYADTSGLGYDSTAAKYGFKAVPGGGGSLTYNFGSSGAAFGVPKNTTMTVLQIIGRR
jgi:hypothetical protein